MRQAILDAIEHCEKTRIAVAQGIKSVSQHPNPFGFAQLSFGILSIVVNCEVLEVRPL